MLESYATLLAHQPINTLADCIGQLIDMTNQVVEFYAARHEAVQSTPQPSDHVWLQHICAAHAAVQFADQHGAVHAIAADVKIQAVLGTVLFDAQLATLDIDQVRFFVFLLRKIR
ncbi:hypothetical protein D3C78_1304090 [compost metagenome]